MRKATFIFSDIINMSSVYKGFSHFLPGCLATLSQARPIGKGCWRHTDEFVFLHRFLFKKSICCALLWWEEGGAEDPS